MNKFLLLLVLLFQLFAHMLHDGEGKGCYGVFIRNSNDEIISNAEVKINGIVAVYDSIKKSYITDEQINGAAIVDIKCDGYIDFTENVFFGDPWKIVPLYVSREGELHYYNYYQVPYMGTLNQIAVFPSSDTMKSILVAMNLEYREKRVWLDKYRRSSYEEFDTLFDPDFNNMLIITKKDSSNFNLTNCVELGKVRAVKNVLFAGFVICDAVNIDSADFCRVIKSSFVVRVKPDKSVRDSINKTNYLLLLKCLQELGIYEDQVTPLGWDRAYTVRFDDTMGYGIVEIMDKLRKCEVVQDLFSEKEPLTIKPMPPQD